MSKGLQKDFTRSEHHLGLQKVKSKTSAASNPVIHKEPQKHPTNPAPSNRRCPPKGQVRALPAPHLQKEATKSTAFCLCFLRKPPVFHGFFMVFPVFCLQSLGIFVEPQGMEVLFGKAQRISPNKLQKHINCIHRSSNHMSFPLIDGTARCALQAPGSLG